MEGKEFSVILPIPKKPIVLMMMVLLPIAAATGTFVWVSSQIGELTEAVQHVEERFNEDDERWDRFDEEIPRLDEFEKRFEDLEGDLVFRDKNGGGCRFVILGLCILHN